MPFHSWLCQHSCIGKYSMMMARRLGSFVLTGSRIISESLVLVRLVIYTYDGRIDTNSMSTAVGNSHKAIIVFLTVFVTFLIAFFLLAAVKKYPSTIPLASCCSARFAACCQSLNGSVFERSLALKELRCGAIDEATMDERRMEMMDRGSKQQPAGSENDVQHATFSSIPVCSLLKGNAYA